MPYMEIFQIGIAICKENQSWFLDSFNFNSSAEGQFSLQFLLSKNNLHNCERLKHRKIVKSLKFISFQSFIKPTF